ncbi:hypothetical protein MOQ_007617 [Trypanosoma cruzi marinkellei]|uniref:Uncharacterized protein n=1 Tax=Trypanosoma cruzi marinkellei TaxID=85056 RepID=K2M147_TRYCR|nr:hypothetical protein MOQ_007617 [Trypanosoma cruzi marinkellei]
MFRFFFSSFLSFVRFFFFNFFFIFTFFFCSFFFFVMRPPGTLRHPISSPTRAAAMREGRQQDQRSPPQRRQRVQVAASPSESPRGGRRSGRDVTETRIEPQDLPLPNMLRRECTYMSLREQFHNRERITVTTRPPVLASPVLDRKDWLYNLFAPCFFVRGNYVYTTLVEATEMAFLHRRQRIVTNLPSSYCISAWGHFIWRFFCLRCSIAELTDILFREEEERGREPYRFCCEGFFGYEGRMTRSFLTMCVVDLLTCGFPFGYFYHGLGTTLFGCRLRYLIRCRYRIEGTVVKDFLLMLCCPLLTVEQEALEMMMYGNLERRDLCAVMV